MSNERLHPLLTLILGLVTLAAFVSFSLVQDVYDRSTLAPAISAFQRSEAGAPISTLFESWAQIRAMHIVNEVDVYAFIPAYTLFLVAAAIFLGGGLRPLVIAAIVAAIVGAGADTLETLAQLRITGALTEEAWTASVTSESIAPLHWLKYGALGVNGLAVALICLVSAPRRWIIGVLALLPLPIVAAAYLGYVEPRLFSIAFALYWIGLIVVAGVSLFRAKPAPVA